MRGCSVSKHGRKKKGIAGFVVLTTYSWGDWCSVPVSNVCSLIQDSINLFMRTLSWDPCVPSVGSLLLTLPVVELGTNHNQAIKTLDCKFISYMYEICICYKINIYNKFWNENIFILFEIGKFKSSSLYQFTLQMATTFRAGTGPSQEHKIQSQFLAEVAGSQGLELYHLMHPRVALVGSGSWKQTWDPDSDTCVGNAGTSQAVP